MSDIDTWIQEYQLDNVQWRWQDCDENSLLFYKFNASNDALRTLIDLVDSNKVGFVCVLSENKVSISRSACIPKELWAQSIKQALDHLHPLSSQTKFVGITGTNGKTTCLDYFRQILVERKVSVLSFGTLGVFHNEKKIADLHLTTPHIIDIQKYCSSLSPQIAVMEMSSHALEQKRVWGLKLSAALWTSFSQDHLDYHQDLKSYYASKSLILDYLENNEKILAPMSDQELHANKDSFRFIEDKLDVEQAFLKIDYNRKNLSLALAAVQMLGIEAPSQLNFVKVTPGRFNLIEKNQHSVIVDFAHTPEAIENICQAARSSFNKRLIVVFGCGGNRDKTKRPLMGRAACKYADYVYITSDNPRLEAPREIINDITAGLGEFKNYETIEERKAAIVKALQEENSLILVLGKGHEAYMDKDGIKEPYSDIEFISEQLND